MKVPSRPNDFWLAFTGDDQGCPRRRPIEGELKSTKRDWKHTFNRLKAVRRTGLYPYDPLHRRSNLAVARPNATQKYSAISTVFLAGFVMLSYAATPTAWFRADAISGVANGGTISSWNDASGNGYNATQSTSSRRPTYVTAAMNGLPVARFNATNSTALNFARPIQDDFTIACVFQSRQGSGSGTLYWAGAGLVSGEVGGTVNDLGSCLFTNGQICVGTGNPDTAVLSANGYNNGRPHLFVFKRVATSGVITLYVDGMFTATTVGTMASLTPPSQLTLGAQQSGGGYYNGDIAEVQVFNTAVCDSDRANLESGLMAKYGIIRPDLVTWFRAEMLTNLVNGSAVQTWPDLSGLTNNATQATTAKQPTYMSNTANGFPAVRFNANNSTTLQFPRPVQDDFTMALVFASTQGSGAGTLYYSGAGLVSAEVGGVVNDFGSCLFANGQICAGTGNPDVAMVSKTGFNDGKPHLVCFTRDRSAGQVTLSVDGLVAGMTLGSVNSLTAPSQLTLGGVTSTGGCFSGDMAEVIIYSNALSSAQQQFLANGLAAKYAIQPAVPVNLAVQSSNGVPLLNWSGSAIASSHNVKRAASANGPFSLIGTVNSAYYADATALATNYYYVVSGVSSTGVEGSNSLPARLPLTLYSLSSGQAILNVRSNANSCDVIISLTNGAAIYQQARPVAINVVASSGAESWWTVPYAAAQDLGSGQYRCTGSITNSNGSVFKVADTYHSDNNAGTFQVDRTVTVGKVGAGDSGFSSKLTLQQSKAGSAGDFEWFVPAIWCGSNNVAAANNLGGYEWLDDHYWFREDRLPLPIIMARQRDNGATLSVVHRNPDGSSFYGEDYTPRLIDSRMQFGSVGMESPGQPALGFVFPGTEGERTLVGGNASSRRWALRAHPVSLNFTQSYSLVFRLTAETSYSSAYEGAWTNGFALYNLTNYACNLDAVYQAGVNILNRYWSSINGAAGVPFRILLNGTMASTNDYNYQMGFTGMEPVNGTILLRAGLLSTNATFQSKGEQMLNFWASNCLTTAGIPKTWYDPIPQSWRSDATWIRTATDGMLGLLWGWKYEKQHGVNKTNWLSACTKFGNWIVSQQAADGSMPRIWDYSSGNVTDNQKNNTSHAIRYLAELYLATGTNSYRVAATNAGNYVYNDSFLRFRYFGGADASVNPDKEAVSMALRAYTALYDLTGDSRWLNAATRAAYYYSTWIYSWRIPIPANDPNLVFPANRSPVGLSLIKMGTSACDSYAATDAFEIYRTYLFTGDSQLLKIARLMLYDTKGGMNWDPANPIPGFGDAGIMAEAMGMVISRGEGVGYYLPWQTANFMEPMMNLQDVFGSYDLTAAEQMDLGERQKRNNAFSLNRGYASAQAIPGIPPRLSASANSGVITLNWNTTASAVFYNLKRSTAPAGPFSTISSQSGLAFVDSNAVWGVNYYYVVSAMNAAGESANSAPVSAILNTPPILTLGVSPARDQLWFSWPGWASTFSLYFSTNLSVPVTWQLVTNPASFTNSTWQLTLANLNQSQQYFRLISP